MPEIVEATLNPPKEEEEEEEVVNDEKPPSMKCLETRDSISSIDSDLSLSYDQTPGNNKENTSSGKEEEDEGAHMADLSDSASETGSTNGGKDSGCEVTPETSETTFAPPSDEIADRIVQQVEFYFSDANIAKDAFLLKHVKRNKEGYVSLKLISSFKRVKHITKDWRVVAHALSRSEKLQVNELGTKLRRVDPLPKYDETTPSRTVVAHQLPVERATIESVAELFRECGEISLVRILRPGNPIPADVRQFLNKHPTLAGDVCALIEFAQSESARKAMQMTTSHAPLTVYELNCAGQGGTQGERKKKTANKKKEVKGQHPHAHGEYASTATSSSEAEDMHRTRMRRGSYNYPPPPKCEPAAWLQRRLSASSTEASFMFMPRRLSYARRDSSDLFIPRRVSIIAACPVHVPPPVAIPLQQQRRASADGVGVARSRSNSAAFQCGEHVLRMPKGPDGSKGFGRQQRAN